MSFPENRTLSSIFAEIENEQLKDKSSLVTEEEQS